LSKNEQQVADLVAAVSSHAAKCKAKFLTETIQTTRLLLVWVDYLRSTVSRGFADRLLDATQGAIIEAAGCLSLGLVRSAVFSIRAQMELLLAWIYYNDHPVEWAHFDKTGKDYLLRAALLSYIRNNNEQFGDRFRILAKKRERKIEDPYGVLSVHVHSISPFLGPTVGPLTHLVRSEATCEEAIVLLGEVAEYVTDAFACWYVARWHDFPADVIADLTKRMTKKELKEFCG
jgi:hypothetical protein